jgi:hypothetical protein
MVYAAVPSQTCVILLYQLISTTSWQQGEPLDTASGTSSTERIECLIASFLVVLALTAVSNEIAVRDPAGIKYPFALM